jgi:hypothetical protein
MKKIIVILTLCVTSISCSNDNSGSGIPQYSYEIKKVISPKWKIEANPTANIFSTLGITSYAMDTLEVNLNAPNTFTLRLDIVSQFDLQNIAQIGTYVPHVNYVKFVNLKPNWNDNIIKTIFLDERNNNGDKFLTYSESNIDLNLHPNLFFYNQYNPTYVSLKKAPKIGVDLETIISNVEHNVNSTIYHNEILYKVISKKIK